MTTSLLTRYRLLVAGSAMLLLAGCDLLPSDDNQQQSPPPPAKVDVVTLASQPVTLTTTLPARTVAYRKAEVRPQVNGIIEQRLFDEGADVEAGQQLYQIEAAPYRAALQTAEAELARARADLKATQARAQRYETLLADRAISRQDFDDADAAYQQAKAAIAVGEAAVTSAQINLRYTRVYAPISGRIGKSSVTEGALVTAGQADVLATIHQLDPIYVDIAQPSRDLLRLRRQLMEYEAAQTDLPSVTLYLEDGSSYAHTGELQFSEVDVQESTGSIVLRAIFPNPDGLLMPGMFVRAELQEARIAAALRVPQRAVSFDREGNATALVVNDNNAVEARRLVVQRELGNDWLVVDGLSAGDRVIVGGLQKARPGDTVIIDNNSEQAS